ncbi:hypothetical protein [Actinomadura sp. 9N407]|uniref:hypothetical protein n=1 Tax=Actinomadura sp. 9N407 TaxID=3375154 RepID=UPI003797DFD1
MESPTCPSWTGKAVRELTAGEIGELLALLEERDGDDLICRVLARELADRTASESGPECHEHSQSWVFE